MSSQEYDKALRAGQKAYRAAVMRGEYPYLPALDDLLERVSVASEVSLGLVDIPLDQIVGTKTKGRQNSFATNFMPLINENSEFAIKWSNLYEYQTSEGVRDPIIAYEFMNKFYVMEGNKRVSVFKFLGAFSIEGYVTRIIPKKNDDPEIRIYYEFLNFYKNTNINYIWFSKEGCYKKLCEAVGKTEDEVWSDEERRDFSSCYTEFDHLFEEKGGRKLPITTADAFLFYLSLYPYHDLMTKTSSDEKDELSRIWKELSQLLHDPEASLVLSPSADLEANLFKRFFSLTSSKRLKVAFIYDRDQYHSSWTYGHELGRTHLLQVFGSNIETSYYVMERETRDIAEVLEDAVNSKNHIIFTTHQRFLAASLKAALEHPEVKILNCSVNQSFQSLRTYYGRMYEAKYLSGMIAGALCDRDKIAYAADFPIYGSVANINAFALGAKMVNPDAKIYLSWSGCTHDRFREIIEEQQITMISDLDMIRPASEDRRYGLYMEKADDFVKLASPIWNWGKFYEQMIRHLMTGTWNKSPETKEKKNVNYWWGIDSGIIDLIVSQKIPAGLKKLVDLLKREIVQDNFHPFDGEIIRQDQIMTGADGDTLPPEEIIKMNYLVDNVIGSIPTYDELTKEAQMLMSLRDNLTT